MKNQFYFRKDKSTPGLSKRVMIVDAIENKFNNGFLLSIVHKLATIISDNKNISKEERFFAGEIIKAGEDLFKGRKGK